jgi:hypothetical protein
MNASALMHFLKDFKGLFPSYPASGFWVMLQEEVS